MTCLRSVRFALPLSSCSIMSQPSSGSSSPAPSNFALLQFMQAHCKLLDTHCSLAEVQDKDAARCWVLDFISTTVSDGLSSHVASFDSS
jgi:hypothetical protein